MAHYWRAALAQLVEQLSCKQQVIGSSPIGGSTEKRPRADESRRGAFCCARRYWRVGGFRSKAVDVLTLGRAGLVCGVFVLWVGAGGWPVRGFVLWQGQGACPGVCVVCGVLACVEESDVGLQGCRGRSRVWTMVFWALARRDPGITAGRGQRSTPECDLDVVWGLVCGLRLCVGRGVGGLC